MTVECNGGEANMTMTNLTRKYKYNNSRLSQRWFIMCTMRTQIPLYNFHKTNFTWFICMVCSIFASWRFPFSSGFYLWLFLLGSQQKIHCLHLVLINISFSLTSTAASVPLSLVFLFSSWLVVPSSAFSFQCSLHLSPHDQTISI